MSTSYEPSGLLNAYLLDGKGGAESLDWEGISRWSPNDGVMWINLDYSIPDAERWLAGASKIPPLAREALLDVDPRPRALAVDDNLQLILRGLNRNRAAMPEDMISIRAWVEPRRIITMRHRVSRSLESVAADLVRGSGPRNGGDLVALLVERALEPVVLRVDTLGDEIAACEDQAIGESSGELRKLLADHRRRAIALRRFLAPQREVFARLQGIDLSWLEPAHRARFAEADDRMTRTIEELDAARDRAAVTQEELASRLAELTNQRLYLLALVTIVFVPLGFVTGLLGVNVGGVPLTGESWAFWALCGLFGIVVACELWLLRRRGWF
jgi:zinc transporter